MSLIGIRKCVHIAPHGDCWPQLAKHLQFGAARSRMNKIHFLCTMYRSLTLAHPSAWPCDGTAKTTRVWRDKCCASQGATWSWSARDVVTAHFHGSASAKTTHELTGANLIYSHSSSTLLLMIWARARRVIEEKRRDKSENWVALPNWCPCVWILQ